MPDSLLPIQGPASYGERDLDRLLSGDGYPAVVLGPVAEILAALCAAPRPDELGGEAAARAAFRLSVLPDISPLGDAPAPDPLHRGTGGQHRLDGPGQRFGLRRAGSAGPRHGRPRRRVLWRADWQVMTVAGSAAAAVIVGAVVLAGMFSGPNGHQGPAAHPPSAPVTATASSNRATSSVLGGGTAAPTHKPATPKPAAGAPSLDELCGQYMQDLGREPIQNLTQGYAYQQLSKVAGDEPWQIIAYCAERLNSARPWANPDIRSGDGDSGTGNPSGGTRPAEPTVMRFSRTLIRSLSPKR